uniref:Uncharacterized protein n=1 Tax=Chlorobium phaeobacteroides (strain BS1) TaxID=331678 RepID=B3EQP6_CHLPB
MLKFHGSGSGMTKKGTFSVLVRFFSSLGELFRIDAQISRVKPEDDNRSESMQPPCIAQQVYEPLD